MYRLPEKSIMNAGVTGFLAGIRNYNSDDYGFSPKISCPGNEDRLPSDKILFSVKQVNELSSKALVHD